LQTPPLYSARRSRDARHDVRRRRRDESDEYDTYYYYATRTTYELDALREVAVVGPERVRRPPSARTFGNGTVTYFRRRPFVGRRT